MAYQTLTRDGNTGTQSGSSGATDAPTDPEDIVKNQISLNDSVSKQLETEKNLTATEAQYNQILKAIFASGTPSNETIDVITQYYWTMNKPREAPNGQITNVPFLYAIEYKQRYGVTMTNLLNNLYGLVNSGGSIGKDIVSGLGGLLTRVSNTIINSLDLHDAIGSIIAKGVNAINYGVNSAANVISNKVGEGITNYGGYSGNTHLNTDLLKPYLFLYSLEATGKQFCFPYFSDQAGGWSANNLFGADGNISILSKSVSEGLGKLSNGVAAVAGDIQDMANFMAANTHQQRGFTMYNIEKAKAFSFPTDGKKIRVSFPLFNTIKKGEWEKNYKFIVLFGIRNMLFRVNNVQYYQPLIYDVSTPGYGRMPLCYVSSYSVKPVGMTRVKSMDMSFLKLNNSTASQGSTVIVPEAWIVEIEFQSLIADSANQFLSSLVDLPITANVVNS